MRHFEFLILDPLFAREVLNKASDIISHGDVQQAASTLHNATEELNLKRRVSVLETHAGFPFKEWFRCTQGYIYRQYIRNNPPLITCKTGQQIFGHPVGICDQTCSTTVLASRRLRRIRC